MTVIQQPFAVTTAPEPAIDASGPERAGAMTAWVARCMPAEVAGAAATVIGGVLATLWTDAPALIALAAAVAGTAGFGLVLTITVLLEQLQLPGGLRRAARRTAKVLPSEFGGVRVFDALLVRPAALLLGVWLLRDPVGGILAGILATVVVLYTLSAPRSTRPRITAETRGDALDVGGNAVARRPNPRSRAEIPGTGPWGRQPQTVP
ncbi:hypothetical protein [Microbacterium kyungheense]|uniref:hypothetical protein n=1 Tax=Microbacterium kyungheense TaxID=1263636 RepID=UPI0031EC0172